MKRSIIFGSLVAALLLSAAAYATAESVTIAGTAGSATGPVAVKATVNPKLSLTIVTPDASQSVDFGGAVDPGTVIGGKTVSLSIDSNKDFSLTKSASGNVAELGLLTTLPATSAGLKGKNVPFTDAYSIDVPWTTLPAVYAASVQYTVTQH